MLLTDITNNNSGCPYCAVPLKRLCDNDDCNHCFLRSFASHNRAKNFSSKNNKTPRQLALCSNEKFLFECDKCNHEFYTALNKILLNRWCPYCATSVKKLCDKDDCQHCFNRSFASSDKAIYWSSKNKLLPRQVAKSSHTKYIFDCNICGHEIQVALNSMVRGNFCAYCDNQKMCYEEDCKICFYKSFASSHRAKCWSNKNNVSAREVFKGTDKKYYFICDRCNNEFSIQLDCVSRNVWCNYCKNKTEIKLYNWLKDNYKIDYQRKYDWCRNLKTNNYLKYDFAIEELKLLIELDGEQHFRQVSNWENNDIVRERDVYKMYMALGHGYSMIRLLQTDVYYDKNDWENKLKECIKNYDNPQIITICDSKKYEKHLLDLDELTKIMEHN